MLSQAGTNPARRNNVHADAWSKLSRQAHTQAMYSALRCCKHVRACHATTDSMVPAHINDTAPALRLHHWRNPPTPTKRAFDIYNQGALKFLFPRTPAAKSHN